MAGMPHVVETGPLFSKLSDRYSKATEQERLDLLTHLYNNPLVVPDSGPLNGGTDASMNDPGLDPLAPGTPSESTRTSHVNDEWLGLVMGAAGHEPRQDPANIGPRPETGWWNKWRGDAHGIMRETLIRALEVSLGLEHLGEAPTGSEKPYRLWEIHFLWICGSPKFEGWLHWRQHQAPTSDGGGTVTVVFSTPGNTDSPLSMTLLAEDEDQTKPPGQRLLTVGNPYEMVRAEVDVAITNGDVYDITQPWSGYVDTGAIGGGPLTDPTDQTSASMNTNRGLVVVGHARTVVKGLNAANSPNARSHASNPGDWTFGGTEQASNPNNTAAGPNEWFDGSDSPIVCIAPESAHDGGQLP